MTKHRALYAGPPTTDDVLVYAKRIINEFGWQRMAHPVHGPAPRCIRSAIFCAAEDLDVGPVPALRRASEAIYGRGSVGGINDWEHRKRTDKDAVIALLQKAIEMGPGHYEASRNHRLPHAGVWPT